MYIHLDEGRVTDAAEAVDLPGLDDENVTGSGFELLPVHGPETATFPHELDLVVRMAMGSGTLAGPADGHGALHAPEGREVASVDCRHQGVDCCARSEEHTSELQSPCNLVCRLLLEKKKKDVLLAKKLRQYEIPHDRSEHDA